MTITIDDIINKLNITYNIDKLVQVVNRLELIYNINLNLYINDLTILKISKENIIKNYTGKDKNIQLFYLEKQRKAIIFNIIQLLKSYQ